MNTGMVGIIAALLGVLALLYGLIMAIGIIAHGWILGISPGGAFDGATTLFLMAIAFFLWPEQHGKAATHGD
jgi:hypothetical protein